MNDFLEKTIAHGLISQAFTTVSFKNAIETKTCCICGLSLMEKGDWIFCPKNSEEIPDCDSLYHMAHNLKTGLGWCESMT